jgi:branched-chain amino acid transport system substrate-binding protein
MKSLLVPVLALASLVAPGSLAPASAEVKVGVIVSATGPGSSLGIPGRNAFTLAPKEIGGQPVRYIVLDDESDPTIARRNVERLTTAEKVDLVIGSSSTPNSLAMVEVAGRTQTPMISLGAGRSIIFPMDKNRRWVFKTPYNDSTTAAATVNHMVASGFKRIATICVDDAYGQGWIKEFRPLAEQKGLSIVASEVYGARDTSVTAQVLRVMAAQPDAVLVASIGTVGALPQLAFAERGYKPKVYQTTGVVNADFLRVGGKAVEGTLIAANPLTVAAQLPDSNPAKQSGLAFTKTYDAAFGAGTTNAFAGYAWDAVMLAQAAIPVALKSAQPGTEAFRAALRDALEGSKDVATTAGPVTMTPENHNGYAPDAPVIITIQNGKYTLVR